jgi:hypothetical protein
MSDEATVPTGPLPHVVIVGAGFGRLNAGGALARRPVRVTLRNLLLVPLQWTWASARRNPTVVRALADGVDRS